MNQDRHSTEYCGIARDKKTARTMHYFLAYNHDDPRSKRSHVFNGTTCWCKPKLRTDWSLLQSGDQVYIYIEHEGSHGP